MAKTRRDIIRLNICSNIECVIVQGGLEVCVMNYLINQSTETVEPSPPKIVLANDQIAILFCCVAIN